MTASFHNSQHLPENNIHTSVSAKASELELELELEIHISIEWPYCHMMKVG